MPFKNPDEAVRSILKNFPSRPLDKATFDALVSKAVRETTSNRSADIRKSQWEYAVKNELFELAMNEGKALNDPETTYFEELKNRLDLALTLTEQDVCEQTFPFNTLQDLLETQTISSCSHVFSWIESNADRLTEGMVPAKGKTLIILRMLNDLLRRLSKMGSNSIFCGRILTFLSGVFPLGERSGVNLRGEYGPMWETVEVKTKVEDKPEDTKAEEVKDVKKEDGMEEKEAPVSMEVEEKRPVSKTSSDSKQEQKDDLYNTFWSLQLPFSRPPLFASPETFTRFQTAVNKVLPIINEATAKERALMGSRTGSTSASHSHKRKREAEPGEETTTTEYFFAKFLTSPELLDLEIADTHFRRQFLFQLLILLNHLLLFTKTSRAIWTTTRNRSLQFEFTLEPPETQWVTETINKAQEELRQTAPGGRAFADSVSTILEREKNRVKWKNDLCTPFDREPYSVEVDGKRVGLWEETGEARKKMRIEPKQWEYRQGTAALTEIWDMGLRDIRDLENPFQPGEVKDFVKKIKIEDSRIEMRKQHLARTSQRIAQARAKATAAAALPAPTPTPPSAAPAPTITTTPVAEPSAPLATTTAPASSPPVRPSALVAPAPTSAAASPALHPSLPAKPGSKPASKSADSVSVAPSSSPAPANPTPVAPAVPVPAPSAPATLAPPTATPAAPARGTTPGATASQTTVTSSPAAPPAPALPKDEVIATCEENKHRLAWLALRTAREQYLAHFGKIGNGDIIQLATEIENEEKAQKELQERAAAAATSGNGAGVNGKGGVGEGETEPSVALLGSATGAGEEGGMRDSPAIGGHVLLDVGSGDEKISIKVEPATKDVEGDVKMEG